MKKLASVGSRTLDRKRSLREKKDLAKHLGKGPVVLECSSSVRVVSNFVNNSKC